MRLQLLQIAYRVFHVSGPLTVCTDWWTKCCVNPFPTPHQNDTAIILRPNPHPTPKPPPHGVSWRGVVGGGYRTMQIWFAVRSDWDRVDATFCPPIVLRRMSNVSNCHRPPELGPLLLRLMFVVRWLLLVDVSLLYGVLCLWFAVCCSLFDCCLLIVVCRLFFVVGVGSLYFVYLAQMECVSSLHRWQSRARCATACCTAR